MQIFLACWRDFFVCSFFYAYIFSDELRCSLSFKKILSQNTVASEDIKIISNNIFFQSTVIG